MTAAAENSLPDRIGEVLIQEKLGEGGRSVVYGGQWREREVALKIYKPTGIKNHQKRHRQNIAEFEYCRNKTIYELPGLAKYVAQPLHHWASPDQCALVQERLSGPLYYFYFRQKEGNIPPTLKAHLSNIINLAHSAGQFDVDMHAFNIIVDETSGEPIPRLFDFNLIPFHERSGISISKILLKFGLTNKATRDKRLLKNLDKVARRERKLVKYFE